MGLTNRGLFVIIPVKFAGMPVYPYKRMAGGSSIVLLMNPKMVPG